MAAPAILLSNGELNFYNSAIILSLIDFGVASI